MDRSIRSYGLARLLLFVGLGVANAMGVAPVQAQELCSGVDYPFPYTDVASVGAAFCPGIMEAYVTGVTRGTTPTTFSPDETVTRVQMTTFLQRSLDQGLARTSRRGALNQWWTAQPLTLPVIPVGTETTFCAADGADIWTVAQGQVTQVQANTNIVLRTWTGDSSMYGLVAVLGKIYVTGATSPGGLYVIDPTQPSASVTKITLVGDFPTGIAFDGAHLWTANQGGSVSIIDPSRGSVNTVTTGFTAPAGILYDGANIWVTDLGADKLFKLDPSGNIIQTVSVGAGPSYPVFDGANIWVPNSSDNSITVVQASSGNLVATIPSVATDPLSTPTAASFDGERILVTNRFGQSVTVFRAADLSFVANPALGELPFGACSDGISFWVTYFTATGGLLRL